MDSFIYSVNATLPIFLVMVLGWALMRRKMLNDEFIRVGNRLMFNVALPLSLFRSVAGTDVAVFADVKLVTYCIVVTTASFGLCWLGGVLLVKNRASRGSFIQGAARGNIAILGLAFIQNMYDGEVGAMPLILAVSVMVQNVLSVVLLSVYSEDGGKKDKKALAKSIGMSIVQNPLIHGLVLGMLVSALRIELPSVVDKTFASVASLATPLALIVLGAGFDFSKAKQELGLTVGSSLFKLIVLPAVFMPVAIALGYRGIELASLLLMSGSSAAVSSYIMAKNMHNDEVLASSVVAVTTLGSSISLTFWIFLLRLLGYL